MIADSSKDTGFIVDLGFYQGPLNLLLYILQKNELSIKEIVMKDIVEQLRDKASGSIDFDILESAIYLINKLILLKIDSLISDKKEDIQVIIESIESELDEFDNFVELQKIKKLAQKLKILYDHNQKIHFPGDFRYGDFCDFDILEERIDVSLSNIIKSYIDIFLSYDEFPLKKALSTMEVSVGEMRNSIMRFISKKKELSFKNDLLKNSSISKNRSDQVLVFFTILSLEKDNIIKTVQKKNFDDIRIIKK